MTNFWRVAAAMALPSSLLGRIKDKTLSEPPDLNYLKVPLALNSVGFSSLAYLQYPVLSALFVLLSRSLRGSWSMSSPIGPPPPGGDLNRASEVYAFTWTLISVALIFVVGRMYSRIKLTRNVWWDDWCVCISLVTLANRHIPS